MMDLTIDAADLAELSVEQKEAILQALFLAVGIDRVIEVEESSRFNKEVTRIPWGVDTHRLRQVLDSSVARRKVSHSAENLAWVNEIAALVKGQTLREKVLATMVRISLSEGLNDAERALLSAVALAFEVPKDRLDVLRAELLPKRESDVQTE